jgi:hypothetical protein
VPAYPRPPHRLHPHCRPQAEFDETRAILAGLGTPTRRLRRGRAFAPRAPPRRFAVGKVSHDPARDNPYELAAVLLSTLDITQQILERGIGRAPVVLMGFLEFLNRNKELLLSGGDGNRIRIRRLAKFLNMHGGVCILDSLSQPQIMARLEAELARILVIANSSPAKAANS